MWQQLSWNARSSEEVRIRKWGVEGKGGLLREQKANDFVRSPRAGESSCYIADAGLHREPDVWDSTKARPPA